MKPKQHDGFGCANGDCQSYVSNYYISALENHSTDRFGYSFPYAASSTAQGYIDGRGSGAGEGIDRGAITGHGGLRHERNDIAQYNMAKGFG